MAFRVIAEFVPGDADLLLVGARVFTESKGHPWPGALGIGGDRLLAAGTEFQTAR